MVAFEGDWTPFADLDDQIRYYRLWHLIPPKGEELRPVMVTDGYLGEFVPCEVVGYETGFDNWAVIRLEDGIHAINGEYLAELQPHATNQIPLGHCFVEYLSHYIVLDIETTGLDCHRDRIIEIAAAEYRYGKKVGEYLSFINPGRSIPPSISQLTGITDADVADAPDFHTAAPELLQFLGNLPIIGHNIKKFDIPFISAELGRDLPNVLIDTLPLARAAFPDLPKYKLAYMKDALHLGAEISHRAAGDVETTNALLWACITPRRFDGSYLRAVIDAKVHPDARPCGQAAKHGRKAAAVRVSDIVPTQEIDPSSPLCGKFVVFTGELSIPRAEAIQIAVNAGATVKSGISKKIHYLVVGKQDVALVGEDGKSGKEEKAAALNASGQAAIQILSESDFLALAQNKEEA